MQEEVREREDISDSDKIRSKSVCRRVNPLGVFRSRRPSEAPRGIVDFFEFLLGDLISKVSRVSVDSEVSRDSEALASEMWGIGGSSDEDVCDCSFLSSGFPASFC